MIPTWPFPAGVLLDRDSPGWSNRMPRLPVLTWKVPVMKTTLRFAVLLSVLAILLPRAGADDAPPKTVAAALQPFVDRHALAGAVALVADKDKVLGVNTVGFADIAGQAPMKPDTLFWIASMSKPIT